MTPRRDVVVEVADGALDGLPHEAALPLPALIARAVEHTLDAENVGDAEISVALLGDDAIQALNRDYLSKDRITDVIAFSLGEEGDVLGDVYIGAPQARRQAEGLGVDFREEVVRLVIHGTLHVLGHDHPDGSDREESPMYRLQERLVREVMGAA